MLEHAEKWGQGVANVYTLQLPLVLPSPRAASALASAIAVVVHVVVGERVEQSAHLPVEAPAACLRAMATLAQVRSQVLPLRSLLSHERAQTPEVQGDGAPTASALHRQRLVNESPVAE